MSATNLLRFRSTYSKCTASNLAARTVQNALIYILDGLVRPMSVTLTLGILLKKVQKSTPPDAFSTPAPLLRVSTLAAS